MKAVSEDTIMVKSLLARNHRLVLLAVLGCLRLVYTFWPGNRSAILERRRISRTVLTAHQVRAPQSSHEAENSTTEGNDSNKACLVFRADYVKESRPAPATSQEAMIEFFRNPIHRNCLISAGNKRETSSVPTTKELLEKWKKRALSLKAAEPEVSDTIIKIRLGGMRFPGIILESTSLIGTKVLIPSESNAFPSYEFLLIQDKRQATGLKPLVWIYDQLTGAGKKEREKDTARISLSRVTVQESEHNKTITFKIETFIQIRINFPAFLLKILPVKKEKAEAQGSQGIAKVIKHDIDSAMAKFRDLYAASLQPK